VNGVKPGELGGQHKRRLLLKPECVKGIAMSLTHLRESIYYAVIPPFMSYK